MVSGVEEPEVVERALEIGAFGYIVKPFRTSEVMINVSSALRRQKLEAEKRGQMEILSKPGRLSDMEFGIIKGHPQVGYEILKGIDFSWPIAEIAYQHHERMDGSGYPRGLKGAEILPEARIVAVADVVEAMAWHRP